MRKSKEKNDKDRTIVSSKVSIINESGSLVEKEFILTVGVLEEILEKAYEDETLVGLIRERNNYENKRSSDGSIYGTPQPDLYQRISQHINTSDTEYKSAILSHLVPIVCERVSEKYGFISLAPSNSARTLKMSEK